MTSLRRLAFALGTITFSVIALSASSTASAPLQLVGGGKGGGTPADVLATVPTPLFSKPAKVTALTTTWTNLAFAAMGGTDNLTKISRVDATFEFENPAVKMDLEISAGNDGSARIIRTVECLNSKSPKEEVTISIPAKSSTISAIDKNGTQEFEASDETLATLKRVADMWNPMLTALGQFEEIERVEPAVYGGVACNALVLAKPRLPGLQSGKLYLDAATNLPVGYETNVVRDIVISGQSTILEWQTESSIKVPKMIRLEGPDGVTDLSIKQVKLTLVGGAVS